MSPSAQRIAIAEACGWKHINGNGDHIVGFDPKLARLGYAAVTCVQRLPDYLTDLNAMHEAEAEFLSGGRYADKYTAYLNTLEEVTNTFRATTQQWAFMFATAAQRAEAFLRTLGKWEDGK